MTANEQEGTGEALRLRARAGSAAETLALARAIGERLRAGHVVALEGELGAGKTHFVKGLAEGLGLVPERVTSPTFTLINEYHGGRLPLYHVDLYRIGHASDLEELGLHELLGGEGVGAVEWIDRFPEVAPSEHLRVSLRVAADESRELTLVARGPGIAATLSGPPAGWEVATAPGSR